jgi:uncharacterized protein YlaI
MVEIYITIDNNIIIRRRRRRNPIEIWLCNCSKIHCSSHLTPNPKRKKKEIYPETKY